MICFVDRDRTRARIIASYPNDDESVIFTEPTDHAARFCARTCASELSHGAGIHQL